MKNLIFHKDDFETPVETIENDFIRPPSYTALFLKNEEHDVKRFPYHCIQNIKLKDGSTAVVYFHVLDTNQNTFDVVRYHVLHISLPTEEADDYESLGLNCKSDVAYVPAANNTSPSYGNSIILQVKNVYVWIFVHLDPNTCDETTLSAGLQCRLLAKKAIERIYRSGPPVRDDNETIHAKSESQKITGRDWWKNINHFSAEKYAVQWTCMGKTLLQCQSPVPDDNTCDHISENLGIPLICLDAAVLEGLDLDRLDIRGYEASEPI